MHAVVDTNILVSALLHADRLPAAVVGGIAAQQLTPVVCTAVMVEYAAVLRRPRLRLDFDRVGELLTLIGQHAVWVEVPAYSGSPDLPDPADWPFVACALATGCPVVTGNAKDFPPRLGVKVVTARQWVEAAA
jgi:predicted nucleic acid-binding protein